MPILAPELRLDPLFSFEVFSSFPVSVRMGLALTLIVFVADRGEDDVSVEASPDCAAVLIGDQEALAIAEKVPVGGDPSHALFPQHSHAFVLPLYCIQV